MSSMAATRNSDCLKLITVSGKMTSMWFPSEKNEKLMIFKVHLWSSTTTRWSIFTLC